MKGMKQPLRFYDSTAKQNWRRIYANGAGLENAQTLINPENSIIPFQIRRKKSLNVIAVFDLYQYDNTLDDFVFELDVLTIIPAPLSNHLRVVQTSEVDNIIWNPRLSFTSDLTCGLKYIHLSDGVFNWYSEVFRVCEFDDTVTKNVSIMPNVEGMVGTSSISWTTGGNNHTLIISKKPY
jgi:hypothetical protein